MNQIHHFQSCPKKNCSFLTRTVIILKIEAAWIPQGFRGIRSCTFTHCQLPAGFEAAGQASTKMDIPQIVEVLLEGFQGQSMGKHDVFVSHVWNVSS